MSLEERSRRVRQHSYCRNCLARSHRTDDCTSDDVCKRCGWPHHTLLHVPKARVGGGKRELRKKHIGGRRSHPLPARVSECISSRSRQRRPERKPAEHSTSGERYSSEYRSSKPKRILQEALKTLQRLHKSL